MRRVRHGSTVYTLELSDPVDRTEDPSLRPTPALPLMRTILIGSGMLDPGRVVAPPLPAEHAALQADAPPGGVGPQPEPTPPPRCALCDAVVVLPETTGGVCGWCFFHARTANRQRWWVRALRWLAS